MSCGYCNELCSVNCFGVCAVGCGGACIDVCSNTCAKRCIATVGMSSIDDGINNLLNNKHK